jgi:hypothetical protein
MIHGKYDKTSYRFFHKKRCQTFKRRGTCHSQEEVPRLVIALGPAAASGGGRGRPFARRIGGALRALQSAGRPALRVDDARPGRRRCANTGWHTSNCPAPTTYGLFQILKSQCPSDLVTCPQYVCHVSGFVYYVKPLRNRQLRTRAFCESRCPLPDRT